MPSVRDLTHREYKRQQETLDLIPSENIASRRAREALASYFTNKYAEGYPGKRYYPGNTVADELERYTQTLVKKVFGLGGMWHVNVQPYSGSPANIAVYFGLLNFGDRVLGLSLTHGGHLTHGHEVNFSGRAYRVTQYGLDPKTGRVDYDVLERLAIKVKPKIIVSGATAYPRTIDFKRIGRIARRVNALHMADIAHIAGLIAAKIHPSPFPYADIVTTTTHKTLRGPRGAIIFCKKEIAERIDRAVFPGLQGGPHLNSIAAIAVALEEALTPRFKAYQKRVLANAKVLARELRARGFTLVSRGTDTHLVLVDVKPLGIDALWAEQQLEAAGILVNRNTVPGDLSPFRPSGLRCGTPFVTSRGFGQKEMRIVAAWIQAILFREKKPIFVRNEVVRLLKRFPLSARPR